MQTYWPQPEKENNNVHKFIPTAEIRRHQIVDGEDKVVGHIRVKPSGVLWSPKNGKVWYGVSLNDFS
jgi:hypothetical protein